MSLSLSHYDVLFRSLPRRGPPLSSRFPHRQRFYGLLSPFNRRGTASSGYLAVSSTFLAISLEAQTRDPYASILASRQPALAPARWLTFVLPCLPYRTANFWCHSLGSSSTFFRLRRSAGHSARASATTGAFCLIRCTPRSQSANPTPFPPRSWTTKQSFNLTVCTSLLPHTITIPSDLLQQH